MKLITTTEDLAAFCKPLAATEFIAVDTEFMRERTYWPKLCLAQVAGPTTRRRSTRWRKASTSPRSTS
jgi:Ribonuclease D